MAFSRRNTCIYSVPSSWPMERFTPQPSWGTWSVCCQSFAGTPASDISGIGRHPPRTCLHPGTARLLAGVCRSGSQEPLNLTPQRGCREQGPLIHGSILDIYSPGLSEPCSAPGMALSTGTHRWEHSPRREGTRSPVGEGHTPPDGGRRVMPYTGSMGRAVGSLRVLWVASNRVRP